MAGVIHTIPSRHTCTHPCVFVMPIVSVHSTSRVGRLVQGDQQQGGYCMQREHMGAYMYVWMVTCEERRPLCT
eukprot:6456345-Pyramimonas_sp.AAC.2